MEDVSVNGGSCDSTTSSNPKKSGRKSPMCAKCLQHGEKNKIRDHKEICPKKDCACNLCREVDLRRNTMSSQTAIRRWLAQRKRLGYPMPTDAEIMEMKNSRSKNYKTRPTPPRKPAPGNYSIVKAIRSIRFHLNLSRVMIPLIDVIFKQTGYNESVTLQKISDAYKRWKETIEAQKKTYRKCQEWHEWKNLEEWQWQDWKNREELRAKFVAERCLYMSYYNQQIQYNSLFAINGISHPPPAHVPVLPYYHSPYSMYIPPSQYEEHSTSQQICLSRNSTTSSTSTS